MSPCRWCCCWRRCRRRTGTDRTPGRPAPRCRRTPRRSSSGAADRCSSTDRRSPSARSRRVMFVPPPMSTMTNASRFAGYFVPFFSSDVIVWSSTRGASCFSDVTRIWLMPAAEGSPHTRIRAPGARPGSRSNSSGRSRPVAERMAYERLRRPAVVVIGGVHHQLALQRTVALIEGVVVAGIFATRARRQRRQCETQSDLAKNGVASVALGEISERDHCDPPLVVLALDLDLVRAPERPRRGRTRPIATAASATMNAMPGGLPVPAVSQSQPPVMPPAPPCPV